MREIVVPAQGFEHAREVAGSSHPSDEALARPVDASRGGAGRNSRWFRRPVREEVGDIAAHYGGERGNFSQAGWDVLLPGGERLQVKALRETGASGPPQPQFYP